MKEFTFKKIDAFATTKSDGNSAGFIRLDSEDSTDKSEMQRIARELLMRLDIFILRDIILEMETLN